MCSVPTPANPQIISRFRLRCGASFGLILGWYSRNQAFREPAHFYHVCALETEFFRLALIGAQLGLSAVRIHRAITRLARVRRPRRSQAWVTARSEPFNRAKTLVDFVVFLSSCLPVVPLSHNSPCSRSESPGERGVRN